MYNIVTRQLRIRLCSFSHPPCTYPFESTTVLAVTKGSGLFYTNCSIRFQLFCCSFDLTLYWSLKTIALVYGFSLYYTQAGKPEVTLFRYIFLILFCVDCAVESTLLIYSRNLQTPFLRLRDSSAFFTIHGHSIFFFFHISELMVSNFV